MKLSYEEDVEAYGPGRRYVYPLPFGVGDELRVGHFSVDAKVHAANARLRGYTHNEKSDGNSQSFFVSNDNFLPVGDLVLDYTSQNEDSELKYWTFKGQGALPKVSANDAVAGIQNELAEDARDYVVFSLRPKFAAANTNEVRRFSLLVDSSQSMVGERFARAKRVVESIVSEMQPGDSLELAACDLECRFMNGGAFKAASTDAVSAFLSGIEPAGSSDLSASLRKVARIRDDAKVSGLMHVFYIGDGKASVGPRSQTAFQAVVSELMTEDASRRISAIGVGQDSDANALKAIARAGGGHFLAHRPGQSSRGIALDALASVYGPTLKNITVEFPAGVMAVEGQRDNLRAGQELIVAGRLQHGAAIKGKVRVKGDLANNTWQRDYDVSVNVSDKKSNTFVPRQWASDQIAFLEKNGADRDRVVALSKSFAVMSRQTSLLVLESPAMFKAFDVRRTERTLGWDEDAELEEQKAYDAHDKDGESLADGAEGLGMLSGTGTGYGQGSGGLGTAQAAPLKRRSRASTKGAKSEKPSNSASRSASESSVNDLLALEPAREEAVAPGDMGGIFSGGFPGRRGGYWARKVWTRQGRIDANADVLPKDWNAVANAERSLNENPDSRDRHKAFVRALSRAGQVERAESAARQWLKRDREDWEALTYLSDAIGRQGRRSEALRYLSGVVDLEPDNVILHQRLAGAFDRFADGMKACAHRVALAENSGITQTAGQASSLNFVTGADGLATTMDGSRVAVERCRDPRMRCRREVIEPPVLRRTSGRATPRAKEGGTELAKALRCSSALGDTAISTWLGRYYGNDIRGLADAPTRFSGKVTLDAEWSGRSDLDLSIITPEGTRISWMGGRKDVVIGDSAAGIGRERLGLKTASKGTYYIEVNRADLGDSTPVQGSVSVNAYGQKRRIPFSLSSSHATLGRLVITSTMSLQEVRR